MKNFLFRLSRLISIVTFVIVIGLFLITILSYSHMDLEGILYILLVNLGFISLIIIFNWLCFGKLTLWIKNPNTENIE